MYKLNKFSGKYNPDITEREYQKCLNDCIVFKGLDIISEMLDYVLQLKEETKRVNNKIVEYNLYRLARKGSGFDRYVVLNNLLQLRAVVSLNKNGSGIVSLKIFNGYVEPVGKFLILYFFRCGLLHIEDSSEKIGKS